MQFTMQPHTQTRRLAAAALLACTACCGCQGAVSQEDRPLVVVVSGDTAGRIVPCGCASNQSGGLPRRATYVKQLRTEADVILADAGGAPSGTSLYDRAKFEAILRGELAMGVAAHNIGAGEAALGADYLRRIAEEFHLPLLSANVSDGDGRPVGQEIRIVKAGGRRVALIGVLGEQFATGDLQVAPPRRAVSDVLSEAAGNYDFAVVLAYVEEDELRQLANALPEVDVVVGGPTGQRVPPTRIGPTLMASATNEGKVLARFDAPTPGSSQQWKGSIVEVNEQIADDEEQIANVRQFRAELARRDFTPDETSFTEGLFSGRAGDRIAGTPRCRECHAHEEDCSEWDKSGHAGAWDSLREKGAHVDPDCQRCHTTGYGLPGGFESVKHSGDLVGIGLVDVGCESCHGPSQAHADDEKVRTACYTRAADRCTGCHDQENSPKFVYDEYWEQIRHGKLPDDGSGALSATTNEEGR